MLVSFFTLNTSTNMQFWLVITPPNKSCTYIATKYLCIVGDGVVQCKYSAFDADI